MGSDKNENTLIGFFARVSYAFDNKYNLLVSVRQEGSSKFGDNNKWGTFPSASLGWTISNEGFIKLLLHVPIISVKIKELIKQKAMEVFGGNFIEIIIGGAPFNAEVEAFLKMIDFPYTIAYGMTECGPIICHSHWTELKLASCGKVAARMEAKVLSSAFRHR